MIDRAHIKVKAGDGGRGGVSFNPAPPHRREGGNGGKGGDVYIKGNRNMNTLIKYYMCGHFEASDGENGNKNRKNGRAGKDMILEFPLGTQIEYTVYDEEIIIDILDEKKVLLLEGGKGGLGNCSMGDKFDHYRTKPPEIREYIDIDLELKVLGNIGFIGMPNAGKSSLINSMTNAQSKVANYAFTTLEPHLGAYKDMILVDLPGIIEGASQGKGLGLQFLSYAERCKIIAIILDISTNPLETFEMLLNEINAFNIDKEIFVILNKIDLVTRKTQLKLCKYFKNKEYKYACISTLYQSGIESLKETLYKVSKL